MISPSGHRRHRLRFDIHENARNMPLREPLEGVGKVASNRIGIKLNAEKLERPDFVNQKSDYFEYNNKILQGESSASRKNAKKSFVVEDDMDNKEMLHMIKAPPLNLDGYGISKKCSSRRSSSSDSQRKRSKGNDKADGKWKASSQNNYNQYKNIKAILREKPEFFSKAEPKPLIGTEFDTNIMKPIVYSEDARVDLIKPELIDDKPDDYNARKLIPISTLTESQFLTYIPQELHKKEKRRYAYEIIGMHRRSNSGPDLDSKNNAFGNQNENNGRKMIKDRTNITQTDNLNSIASRNRRSYNPPELKLVDSSP